MKLTYHVHCGTIVGEDGGERNTYGIEMRCGGRTDRIIEDVFTDAGEAERFAALCNRLEVSSLHFDDVVADAVSG
jgi:hypothetical protein